MLYIVFCVSNVKEKTINDRQTDKYLFTEVFSKFELHIDNPFCEYMNIIIKCVITFEYTLIIPYT